MEKGEDSFAIGVLHIKLQEINLILNFGKGKTLKKFRFSFV